MEKIIRQIENNEWDEAMKAFLEYSDTHVVDARSCIIGATLMEHYREHDTMFSFIADGLKMDPSNYELYILLGNYYALSNPDQAYLSYENALYHCSRSDNTSDLEAIRVLLNDYRCSNSISVRNVSFAILSYNTFEYTKGCIQSIRQTCCSDNYEIIVVDNASTDGSVEWLREQEDVILIENDTNVGFPAGCNQCINKANPENDIFLLNNDTLMLPNSLFWLRIGLYNDDRTGAAGAVTNCSGNGQQLDDSFNSLDEYLQFGTGINIPSQNAYELKVFLIMFAMLIKRKVLDKIGLLDERYTPGNFEDNDYGMRLLENGYDCVLCHNCYIYHYGSKSFGSDVDKYVALYETNREKFRDKWGFYIDRYVRRSKKIISLMEAPSGRELHVLEIGCGFGETLAAILYHFPEADLHGVEFDKHVAELGFKLFDIRCTDPIPLFSGNDRYDYIIISDLPKDAVDPETLLASYNYALRRNGYILVDTLDNTILWRNGV